MPTVTLDTAARRAAVRRQELRRSAATSRFNGGRAKRRAAVRAYRNRAAITEQSR